MSDSNARFDKFLKLLIALILAASTLIIDQSRFDDLRDMLVHCGNSYTPLSVVVLVAALACPVLVAVSLWPRPSTTVTYSDVYTNESEFYPLYRPLTWAQVLANEQNPLGGPGAVELKLRQSVWFRLFAWPLAVYYARNPTPTCPTTSAKELRSLWRKYKPRPTKPNSDHSHAQAAARRTTARQFIDFYAKRVKLPLHEMSGTTAGGSWKHHFATDSKKGPRDDDRPIQEHVLSMVDVDYYVDLPSVLVTGADRGMRVAMFYTFNPDALTGTSDEARYFFTADSEVVCQVNGGSCYKHRLWDFGYDSVVVRSGSADYCFLVERRHLGEGRYLVALFHTGVYTTIPDAYLLTRQQNRRSGSFIFRAFIRDNLKFVSAANASDVETGVTLSHDAWVHLLARAQRAEHSYVGQLETVLNTHKECTEKPARAAALVALWLDQGFTLPGLQAHFSLKRTGGMDEFHYEPEGPVVSVGPPSMQVLTEPVIDGAAAPTRGVNSETSMVQGRITDVANKAKVPHDYHRLANEFMRRVLPSGTLPPADHAEVQERQSRPSQRAKAKQHAPYQTTDVPKFKWQLFQKAEAYDSLNCPRPISNPNQAHKEEYSRYTYPLSDHFCRQPWYAFGKSPTEIAERVHELAQRASNEGFKVSCTDYSKWDGRKPEFLAHFEKKILLRSYDRSFAPAIGRLWSNHYKTSGVTTTGVKVKMGWGRPSGSPDTALFNTVDNALIAYCAFRKMGLSEDVAFDRLGVYGGDDGFNIGLDLRVFRTVCDDLGVKFTGDEQDPIQPLSFLGRVYVAPSSSPASVVDAARALGKLHLGPKGKPAKQVLADKIGGLLTVDPQVPLFSDLLRTIAANEGLHQVDEPTGYWAAVVKEKGPFPSVEDPAVTVNVLAANLGLTPREFARVCDQIKAGKVPKLPALKLEVKVNSVHRGHRRQP